MIYVGHIDGGGHTLWSFRAVVHQPMTICVVLVRQMMILIQVVLLAALFCHRRCTAAAAGQPDEQVSIIIVKS